MKRFLLLALAIILCFFLFACEGSHEADTDDQSNQITEQQTEGGDKKDHKPSLPVQEFSNSGGKKETVPGTEKEEDPAEATDDLESNIPLPESPIEEQSETESDEEGKENTGEKTDPFELPFVPVP